VPRGPELLQFVEAALDLYDQALLTHTHGITFLEQHAAQVVECAVCRVCGEEIHEGLIFCRRCKTPHHRECWQYVGRCSVFACGETQFREPQLAERAPGDTGKRRSSD
jgi:Prokaryotic RING finger family 1